MLFILGGEILQQPTCKPISVTTHMKMSQLDPVIYPGCGPPQHVRIVSDWRNVFRGFTPPQWIYTESTTTRYSRYARSSVE